MEKQVMATINLSIEVDKKKLTAMALGCMVIGALVGTTAQSFADGDLSTSTVTEGDLVIPYDGFLMLDSTSVNGTQALKFELFQQSAGGAPIWTETQDVNLYNGRFSVGLGAVSSLTTTILDAEKLYLAVTIIEDDGMGNLTEVALSGRQAIEPAPHAAWSGHSANFKVANSLKVGDTSVPATAALDVDAVSGGATARLGQLTMDSEQGQGQFNLTGGAIYNGAGGYDYISTRGSSRIRLNDNQLGFYVSDLGNGGGQAIGDVVNYLNVMNIGSGGVSIPSALSVGSASTFTGPMTVNNAITSNNTITAPRFDGALKPAYQNWTGNTGAGGAGIVNDNNVYKSLMIVGNNSAGGERVVEIFDNLVIDDNLNVGDNATISGNLTVTGKITGFSVSGEKTRNSEGTGDLGLNVSNGFCFLTKHRRTSGGGDPGAAECNVYTDGNGNWKLYNNEGGGASLDIDCSARCVTF